MAWKLKSPSLATQAHGAGAIAAGLAFALLWLAPATQGLDKPVARVVKTFTVATLRGEKQAQAAAPDDAMNVVEAVVSPSKNAAVQVPDLETSLPEAVAAAPINNPKQTAAPPVADEVIPPATVAMPGGRLALDDVPLGQSLDDLGIVARQVGIAILVDAKGVPIRGIITRPGKDSVRDRMILRAMLSRLYKKADAPMTKLEDGRQAWQIDMVIQYGNFEDLP